MHPTITGVSPQEMQVQKPTFVLPLGEHLYVSSFWGDEVVRIPAPGIDGSGRGNRGEGMITFAKGHGLDGPWGLAVYDGVLFVASFTTDTIHQ
jgi:hypothetical protein